MTVKYDSDLWDKLDALSTNSETYSVLAEYLKGASDPRYQDVYEVSLVDCPQGLEDDERVAFVIQEGSWWQLCRLTKHVLARILPGTTQRDRAEKYGKTYHTESFDPPKTVREELERKFSRPEMVAAELDRRDNYRLKKGRPRRAPFSECDVRGRGGESAFYYCRASLIHMQFGTNSIELAGRSFILTEGPRVETFAEYQALHEKGLDLDPEPYLCLPGAIAYIVKSRHFPWWMEELRKVNPGRFEWIMHHLAEHEAEYPGVLACVQAVVPYQPQRTKKAKRPRRKK